MRVLHVLGWLILAAGLILQLWLKDGNAAWALAFYGMPKPCLIVLGLVLVAWPRQTRHIRLLALTNTLSITFWWISASWCVRQKIPTPDTSRPTNDVVTILYWNLCRPSGLDQEMVDLVKELQPQLAAFVEPGKMAAELIEQHPSTLPGYEAAWMPRGILWLSKVPSRYRERGKLDSIGAFARFDVDGLGATFPVVVVDVYPELFISRKQQLQDAFNQTLGRRDAIVVGDFNTPLESMHLAHFRNDFVEAFEVAGSGFKETWPFGLPLLSLDHVWVGPDWEVVGAKKIWRLTGSDHAAIFVTLRRK
jgi:endonuclease/exonuclease/phosphatase (EEP) superfamily protein YafD